MKNIKVHFTIERRAEEVKTYIELAVEDDVLTDILSDNMGYRIDLKSMLWLYCKLMRCRFVDIDRMELSADDVDNMGV